MTCTTFCWSIPSQKLSAGTVVSSMPPENPVLIVKKGANTLRIPRNKSVAWFNDKEVQSDGVTVYNGSRWFVAKNLLQLIQ